MSNSLRPQKRLIADINIVPYVDVMLVLLVIFMATAPMLTQGVHVHLPSAQAESLPQDQKPPLVISVDAKGNFYLDQAQDILSPDTLAVKVKAALLRDPNRNVLVRGDKNVEYGHVVSAMVLLKKSGATKLGLMTQQYDEKT